MSGPYHLRARSLSKAFVGPDGERTWALRDVSFDVAPGELVVVIGPNGSGKSTLLDVLNRSLAPDGPAELTLHGANGQIDMLGLDRQRCATFVARVRQDPSRGTFSGLSATDNLAIAALVGTPSLFSAGARVPEGSAQRLEALRLHERRSVGVGELSGGQRQLLALEMALARNPAILLLDEHTSALDPANARACMHTTLARCRDQGVTVVMVTHNIDHVMTYGDRLLVLRDGALVANLSGHERAALSMSRVLALCGYIEMAGREPADAHA